MPFSGKQARSAKPTSDFDALVAHASEERNKTLNNTHSEERLFKSFDEPNRSQVSSTSNNHSNRRGPRTPSGSPQSRRSKSPPSSPKRRRKSDSTDKQSQSVSCSRSRSASSCRSSSTSSRSRSSSHSSRSRSSSTSSESSDDGKSKRKTEPKKHITTSESNSLPPQPQKSAQPLVQQLPKYTLHLQNTTSIQNTIMYTAPIIAQKGYKVTTNPTSSSGNKLPTSVKIVNSSNLSGGGVKYLTGLNSQQIGQTSSALPVQMALLPPTSNGVAQGYQILFAPSSGLSFHPVSNNSGLQGLQNRKPGSEPKSKIPLTVTSAHPVNMNTPVLNSQSINAQLPNLNLLATNAPVSKNTVCSTTPAPKVTNSVSNSVQMIKTSIVYSNTQPPKSTPFHTYSAPKTSTPQLPAPKPRAPSARSNKPKQQTSVSHLPPYGALVTLNSNLFTVANPVYGLSSSGVLPDFSKGPPNLDGLSQAPSLPVYNPNIQQTQTSSVQSTSLPSPTQAHAPAHGSTTPKIPAPYNMGQHFTAPSGSVDPRSLLRPPPPPPPPPPPRVSHYSPPAVSPGKTQDVSKDHYPNPQIPGSQPLLLQSSISPRLPSSSATFTRGQSYPHSQYTIEQQGLPTVIGLRPDQSRNSAGIHLQGFQSVPGPRLIPEPAAARSGFSVYAPRGKRV